MLVWGYWVLNHDTLRRWVYDTTARACDIRHDVHSYNEHHNPMNFKNKYQNDFVFANGSALLITLVTLGN